MLEVIMIEPKTPGNLGAVARAMKNFDFKRLVLINPGCSVDDLEAKKRAKHAQDILKKAVVKDFDYLNKPDYLIGTTAITGSDYNVPRVPLMPEQLAEKLAENGLMMKKRVALLIGREDRGLLNKELEMCDFIATVPGSKKYPVLNISHSVAILLYEIFRKTQKKTSTSHIAFASGTEKKELFKRIDGLITNLGFSTPTKKETQKKVWRKVLGKAMLSKRELFALHGFFRKIKNK